MPKTITVKGKGIVDEGSKFEALNYLNENASTEELQKLAKLAKNPMYRGMLKNL